MELFTARYTALDSLPHGTPERRSPVAVRVGPAPPIVPVRYALREVARTLVPTGETLANGGGEWRPLCHAYWRQLDRTGAESIAGELAAISARNGGRPLALCGEDDPEKGNRDPRLLAAAWLEEKLGVEVPELTADGRRLRPEDLPKRVRPKRPKRHDARWTHGAEPLRPWPLTDDDLRAWVSARYWQFARTSPRNPHEYSHRDWGDEEMFLRVVAHVREHGRLEEYGGDTYTVFDLDEFFYWSMGDPAAVTVIVNRKYHDPEEQARLAEERTGRSREELGLKTARGKASGGQAIQPRLSESDPTEEA
jgi:hypothetical protein